MKSRGDKGAEMNTRYNSVTIILHWVMALAFLLMFTSGIIMEYIDIDKSMKYQLFQWHKGGGVLLLLAAVLRLGVRIVRHAPPLPDVMPALEKKLAKLGHWGLYVLMFVMPISGWLMVSSSSYGLPTIVFGLFEWPHIPGVAANEAVHDGAGTAHFILAIIFGLLIAGHIAAVIKHAVIDKENLLKRMWWSK